VQVLVDAHDDGDAIARTYADAPEIDGLVRIEGAAERAPIGEFVDVEIVDADEYDLFATLI
jgi:ribosomal protein S12 methylthiotransferase